ncbi:MAG TPA: hypothetical protein VIC84_17815 [Blastocatellia bacterium]
MKKKAPGRVIIFHRVLSDPLRIEHALIGVELFEDADADPWRPRIARGGHTRCNQTSQIPQSIPSPTFAPWHTSCAHTGFKRIEELVMSKLRKLSNENFTL